MKNRKYERMSDKMPYKEVFFKDDEMLYRSSPGEYGFFQKIAGSSDEWKTTARENKRLYEALLMGNEITKEEYYLINKEKIMKNKKDERMSDKMPFKEVFFKDDIEGMLFRSVPEQGLWAKFKGGSEEWKTSARQSKIVTDAILAGDEITREEYYR